MIRQSFNLVSIFVVLFTLPIAIFAQHVSPSAEKQFLKKPPEIDRNDAVNAEVLRNVIGFPFSVDGLDAKTQKFMKSAHNNELIGIKKEILEAYWNNHLSEENRLGYLRETIQRNYAKAADVTLDDIMNRHALASRVPEMNPDELLAAFILSSRTGEIADIIPYLFFSNIYVGDDYFAFGYPGVMISFSQAESIPDTPLPPEKRLAFWPAANAILKNPSITVPMLIETVKDKNIHRDLRLRAATFLNTIDAKTLRDRIGREPADLQKEIQSILDDDIRWRHSLYRIGYFDRHDPVAYYELKRKQMKLPPDADVKTILKEMDQYLWGSY